MNQLADRLVLAMAPQAAITLCEALRRCAASSSSRPLHALAVAARDGVRIWASVRTLADVVLVALPAPSARTCTALRHHARALEAAGHAGLARAIYDLTRVTTAPVTPTTR